MNFVHLLYTVGILGPVDYKPGEAIGAPDHPHRGFETVTYIIDGGIEHKDSAGNTGNSKLACQCQF